MRGSPGSWEAGRVGPDPSLGQLLTCLGSQVTQAKPLFTPVADAPLWTSRLTALMAAVRSEHRWCNELSPSGAPAALSFSCSPRTSREEFIHPAHGKILGTLLEET